MSRGEVNQRRRADGAFEVDVQVRLRQHLERAAVTG